MTLSITYAYQLACGKRQVRFFLPHGYAKGARVGAGHLPGDLSNEKAGAPAWAIQLHRARHDGASNQLHPLLLKTVSPKGQIGRRKGKPSNRCTGKQST